MSTSMATVAYRDFLVFKLRMQKAGIYMTEDELEALRALLVSEHASPVRDYSASLGRNWIILQSKHERIER